MTITDTPERPEEAATAVSLTQAEIYEGMGQGESTKPSYKFDALTGLRFFAAFFVFLGHSDQFFLFDATGTLRQMSLGVCVTVFFVLSGFVLSHAYAELPTATSVKDFLVARIAKIWPIHALTLTLFIFAVKIQPQDLDLPTFFASLFLVHDWIPFRDFYLCYNNVDWSLSVELLFYLAFPLLIARRKKFLNGFFIAAAILTSCMIVTSDQLFQQPAQEQFRHYFAYWCPLVRLVDFIIGMQAYAFYARYADKLRGCKLPWSLLEVGTLSLLLFWLLAGKSASHFIANGTAPEIVRTGFEVWLASAAPAVIAAAFIFLIACGNGVVSRLLATKPMIAWGDRSFVLYMIHFTFFGLILGSQVGWQPLPPLVLISCVAVLVFVGSDFLYRTVEVPARRFIRARWTSTGYTARVGEYKKAKTFALLVAEALFLCCAISFFYGYNTFVHGRQLLPGSQSIKFSDQYVLDDAYWESDGANSLLELNWRNLSDHKVPHQLLLQMLPDAYAATALKSKEIAMEDETAWKKNKTLKMRLYFAPTDLKGSSTIGLTIHEANGGSVCKQLSATAAGAAERERLLLQLPERD